MSNPIIIVSTNNTFIPSVPNVVLNTNFITAKSTDDAFHTIVEVFKSMDISFEFTEHIAEYSAVCAKGAMYISFQVRLFNADCGQKIVEVQRLSGDGFAFNIIFNKLMRAFSNDLGYCANVREEVPEEVLNDCMRGPLTDEEVSLYLVPMVRMAGPTESIESQLQGCRLICDIISDKVCRQQLLDNGCVETLIRLALSSDFLISLHAVLGLVELATSPANVPAIWNVIRDGAFIEFLRSQDVDGPYYDECMRRNSLKLLDILLTHA